MLNIYLGRVVSCKRIYRKVPVALAFFHVVAINTNFSTNTEQMYANF